MSRAAETLGQAYFDRKYAADPDPWRFASSPYERRKYEITLKACPKRAYSAGLEIGCSIGALTEQLALRCDHLLAIDASAAPLIEARRRCAELANVRFEQLFVPEQWPAGSFDLIVLSEVVYYLVRADVARLASHVAHALAPRGDIVLVHWTGETDYPLAGDEAAELFIERIDETAKVLRRERHQGFRLDVLTRR
jgi:SAM-dependent methyltransferase